MPLAAWTAAVIVALDPSVALRIVAPARHSGETAVMVYFYPSIIDETFPSATILVVARGSSAPTVLIKKKPGSEAGLVA